MQLICYPNVDVHGGLISRAISKKMELAIGETENIFEDQWLLLYIGSLERDCGKAYGLLDMLKKHKMLNWESSGGHDISVIVYCIG